MSSTELAEEASMLTHTSTMAVGAISEVDNLSDQETIKIVAKDNEVEVTQSQSSTTKNEEGENKLEHSPSWRSAARLYCTENGRPHSVLVDFGWFKCPKCGDDLTQPKNVTQLSDNKQNPNNNKNPISNKKTNGSENTKDNKNTKDKQDLDKTDDTPKISYMIEYKDKGGYTITNEPWGKPFDLQTARGAIVKPNASIFEVVTVLGTTIPQDSRRLSFEIQKIKDKGILNNPAIGVTVLGAKMVIKSAEIIKAITSVVRYYPSVNMEGSTITIQEPYPLIAHHMEQLEAYVNSTQGTAVGELVNQTTSGQPNLDSDIPNSKPKDSSAHLKLLLGYIKDSVYKNHITEELSRQNNEMTCTFRMLWLLFKPGDTVYCETENGLGAFVVSRVKMDDGIFSAAKSRDSYKIDVWNLDFDGRFVGRRIKTVTIPQFEGERAITSLQVFPCDYLDRKDKGEMRQKLEQYGKRWYESLTGRQVYYSGQLAYSRNQNYHGRAYIDSVSYYSEKPAGAPKIGEIGDMGSGLPKCSCDRCEGTRPHPSKEFRWETYDVLDPLKDRNLETDGSQEPPRHRYMLCSRLLWGIMLKTRIWARLDVANCSTPKANTRAIESLVMPEERKTMIKALVQRFSNNGMKPKGAQPWLADHMENKGEGQIFLLHGGPGVGKTFTAECIAEYTGRALLSLTGGDIGTDETKVEANLSKWFKLAETWGAIMLIDEADVYLERREFADLKRNSLVSVFLRCTEYYRGILFLTSNRVGTFDDAFMSRIHVVIAYENLGPSDRAQIWKQFFNKLSEDRQDMTVAARAKRYVLEDEELIKLDWNGREIRNAFQTAVALAEYRFQQKQDKGEDEGPVLDQRDFEQVLDMTYQFKKYLEKVHDATMDERAFRNRHRAGLGEE